jgi:L-amino acid N-acyltransferase YncA
MTAHTDPPGVVVRPARADDVAGIAQLYDALSDASYRSRFLTRRRPDGSAADARLLPGRTVSLVACDADGAVLAEARFERHDGDDEVAELAVTVRDDVQGRGLGRELLGRLTAEARRCGVQRLLSVVRTDNIGMLALLSHAGLVLVEPTEGGVAVVETSTEDGVPGWGRRGTRPRVLVEAASWWDPPQAAALREAGYDVRQCRGPGVRGAPPCPLLTTGSCPLVEQADVVLCLLADADARCRAVREDHRRRRPEHLLATR